jgi:hypothetical protein
MNALPSIPLNAIVFVDGSRKADRLRFAYRRLHGCTATTRLSIAYGDGYRGWAMGHAIRSGRPFLDLSTRKVA